MEEGPKPPLPSARKFAASGPVHVVVHKISDAAGDVWERYKGSDEPMWQLQIAQDTARSITYQDEWFDKLCACWMGGRNIRADLQTPQLSKREKHDTSSGISSLIFFG